MARANWLVLLKYANHPRWTAHGSHATFRLIEWSRQELELNDVNVLQARHCENKILRCSHYRMY